MGLERVTKEQQLIGWIRPMATACLVATLFAWIGVYWLYQRQAFFQLNVLSIVASLLMVCAILIPSWTEQWEASADQKLQQIIGDERMATLVNEVLGTDWTLFPHLKIGAMSEIDGVLVGRQGVFALAVKTGSLPHRNQKDRWQIRTDDQGWQPIADNPSHQVTEQADQLSRYLSAELVNIVVHPRVVWVGDEWLLTENPVVPIWNWQQPDTVSADVEQLEPLSAELLPLIRELF